MTKEQIEKLDSLRGCIFDVEQRMRWMDDWSKNLYPEDNDELGKLSASKFRLTIHNDMGKCVLQRDISREDVESEYHAELQRLQHEKERIEKEIEEL